MNALRLIAVLLVTATILLSVSGGTIVTGDGTGGTFTFTVQGYTITGTLTSGIVTHGGYVQLQMSIDQSLTTSYGTLQITGTGVWDGRTDFQTFSGTIDNVQGTIQACALLACQNVDFTGSGTWTGTMAAWNRTAGSVGSGTFQGTLNFTGSAITPTGPEVVSGTWTAPFEI
jgi:hypothetical protein